MNVPNELNVVNEALSVVQILGVIQRLGSLAEAALTKGQTHVSPEDMAASVAADDAAMAALRAAIAQG